MNTSTDDQKKSQILVCWIGDTDLLALGKEGLKSDIQAYLLTAKKVWRSDKPDSHDFDTEVKKLDLVTRNSSIVLALRENKDIPAFSKVILLTNRPSGDKELLDEFRKSFASFLCKHFPQLVDNVCIEFVPDSQDFTKGVDGWNYAAVYAATKKVLETHIKNGDIPEDYWFNITPGTIAQSTSLILLGKELSSKTNFIQVEKSRQRVDHCEIPFDISAVLGKNLSQLENSITTASGIIGKTPCFLKALNMARRIAWAPVSVLLTGPSGTGKEVFAREIHRLSGRPEEKFIAVNCAMLSKETGLTELTGYFKGAYTGADKTTPGKFDAAKGGTLFLDEIGDCPADVQAELLRFLQPLKGEKPTEREWRLKGAEPTNPTAEEKKYLGVQRGDIRVIAATNKNLLNPDNFRQDLYFRLETIQIKLPSLEERKSETDEKNEIDDLKDLADFILEQCNKAFGLPQDQRRTFSKEAYSALRTHEWAGNVRELQNVITRLSLLSKSPIITEEDVISNLDQNSTIELNPTKDELKEIASALARLDIANRDKTLDERTEEFRHAYCSAALHATGGNKKDAYTILKVAPKTFDKCIANPTPQQPST